MVVNVGGFGWDIGRKYVAKVRPRRFGRRMTSSGRRSDFVFYGYWVGESAGSSMWCRWAKGRLDEGARETVEGAIFVP